MWSYSYTNSQDIIFNGAYIPISSYFAQLEDIFNGNNIHTGLGFNEFNASPPDDPFYGKLKSSGCPKKDEFIQKNFMVVEI